MSHTAHLAAHYTALGTALQPVQMSRRSAGQVVQSAASAHLQAASASITLMRQMYLRAGKDIDTALCLAHLLASPGSLLSVFPAVPLC